MGTKKNIKELKIEEIISSKKIIVSDEFGKLLTTASRLRNNNYPTIQTALNKKEYFTNKSNKVHNNKYIYNKVLLEKIHDKVWITCKEHGDFLQQANSHLQGKGCPICGTLRNHNDCSEYIKKANFIHKEKYDYSFTEYNGSDQNIIIVCKEHGQFTQKANIHLRGFGCKKCSRLKKTNNSWNYSSWTNAAKSSKKFKEYTFYIIKCYNEEESFFKIGKTFNDIKLRFSSNKKMPYKYEIIKTINGESLYISRLEQEIKSLNKNNKYLPKISFGGRFECFTKINFKNELYCL